MAHSNLFDILFSIVIYETIREDDFAQRKLPEGKKFEFLVCVSIETSQSYDNLGWGSGIEVTYLYDTLQRWQSTRIDGERTYKFLLKSDKTSTRTKREKNRSGAKFCIIKTSLLAIKKHKICRKTLWFSHVFHNCLWHLLSKVRL